MRNPYLRNGDPASHWIYFDFDDRSGIRIGGRRPHAAALVQRGRLRWSVAAHRADRAEAGFGETNSLLKRDSFFRLGRIEHAFVSKSQPFFRHFQFFSNCVGNDCSSAFRGLQCGVSRHQRDSARIRAKIHGSEIRVAGEQSNVERVEAQNLGNYSRENIVRALSDFRRAAENRNAAAAVEFELNPRVRHFVQVNGKSRPSQISRASQSYAVALREFAEFFFPIGDLDNTANALGKIDGPEAEKIRRDGVRRLDDAKPQICRINLESLRDLVELDFLTEARLRSAMSALGSAGWLICEGAAALVAIARNVVRGGLQCASVERAGNSVRAVGATVDQRLEMHSRNRAVLFDTGFEFHQDRMPPPVTIENFFACQANLNGPIEHERGLGQDDLMIKRVALSSETPAVRCGDHANMRG